MVVDDDLGGPYAPGPSDWTHKLLGAERVGRYEGGSRVVLAFAEPRAWKGRSGFGPESRDALANVAPNADLIVLFGHPRLLPELPLSVFNVFNNPRLSADATLLLESPIVELSRDVDLATVGGRRISLKVK